MIDLPRAGQGVARTAAPSVALETLDELWFQVAGTVCNLRCRHCFISCSPDNHSFWFMTREQVNEALKASVDLGVKEYYFTGGEPFMNREIEDILADALALGPTTVLTNATLLPPRRVRRLARMASSSIYSLEIRVSLDGTTAESNDRIRGPGAFERAMEGVRDLVSAGFLPIITAMQTWDDAETEGILADFRALLSSVGYDRARIKILPRLQIGAEASRTEPYHETERVTFEMMEGFDASQLLCTRARLVTAAGVQACPILLEAPEARMGDSLREAVARPVLLSESACFTCYLSGSICSNTPASSGADR